MTRSRHGRGSWRARSRWRSTRTLAGESSEARTDVRFVGEAIDPDSGEREGFIQIAVRVARSGELPPEADAVLREELDWLTSNLASPRRLSPFRRALRRGRMGRSRRTGIAISWFKGSATEHLARARGLAELLRHNGHPINEISTDTPGYVTHEDPFQVVAAPFKGELPDE